MERKFTKGQWEPQIIDLVDYKLSAVSTESKVICHCLTNDFEESIANTKLICAAPEMLEVLETIENDANQVPEWLWLRIKAVIEKATECNSK